MGRKSILAPPASVLGQANRGVPVNTQATSDLQKLPAELVLDILWRTDLFTRIKLARCSTFLAISIYDSGLLHFDSDNISLADRTFLLDAEMRLPWPERSYYLEDRDAEDDDDSDDSIIDDDSDSDSSDEDPDDTDIADPERGDFSTSDPDILDLDTNLYDDDPDSNIAEAASDNSEHYYHVVRMRPACIHCKVCNFRQLNGSSSDDPAFRVGWVRHIRIEARNAKSQLPKKMVPLIRQALRLVEEEHEKKMVWAGFLTLKVQRLGEIVDEDEA